MWIDTWASVGTAMGPGRGAELSEVLASAATAHIGLSLVRLRHGARTPQLSFEELLSRCQDHPGVAPVASIAPYRMEGHRKQLVSWADAGAAAVELPGHLFSAEPDAATLALLDDLAVSGLPLNVSLSDRGQATVVGRTTEALNLPTVLADAAYAYGPDAILAAARYEHLYLETSRLSLYRQLERACHLLGPERLLLGSGSPSLSTITAVQNIITADLSRREKRLILVDNAAHLFSVGSDLEDSEVPDPIALPAGTMDVHTHTDVDFFDVPWLEADRFGADQRAIGITESAASSVLAITGDTVSGNRRLAAAAARGDVFGYLVADPKDPVTATAEAITRLGGSPGIQGAKIHCQWSETPTESERMVQLFALLARWGRPVKIHVDGVNWPTAIAGFAETYPQLPIILAHAGPGVPTVDVIPMTNRYPNVYIELASSMADPETVRRIGAEAAREQVLFGTDAPLLSVGVALGTYLTAGLDPTRAAGVYNAHWQRAFG